MRTLGLLVAAALVLSGCSGSDAKTDGPVIPPPEPGKANIAGVVVDDAIRPVVGANVTLKGPELTVKTDADGEFLFTDLEPGAYFIGVSAVGYLAVQSSADVGAGELVSVKIQLRFDPKPQPYPLTWHVDGFMQAWGGIGQYYLEEFTGNGTGTCTCRVIATPDPNATAFIYEAYWDHSLPDPEELAEYYWVVDGPDVRKVGYCYSPCIQGGSMEDFQDGNSLYARLDGPDFTVAFQQKFQLFFTVWHNGDSPDGWTVANTGA